ncbi:MAG: lysylphosphatidylglycerol synthase transmembrane domain-containing protein [Ignavibacteria bacterium]
MTSDKKRIDPKKITGYVISILLTTVFLYLAFRNVDLNEAFYLVTQASPKWVVIFIIIFLIAPLIRAYRWKVLIRSVKPDASVVNLFGATMIGYGINCVIPRMGELYRALFLGKWEKISRSSMVGTVIVERIIDVIALAFSVIVSGLIYSGDLYEEITWLKPSLYLGFVFIFVLIMFIYFIVVLKDRFYNMIIKYVGKISSKAAEKLAYILDMLIDGFNTIKSKKDFLIIAVTSAVIMVFYGLNSYAGFFMMKMDTMQEVTFGMAWILMTIGAFGVVIPTPGGTGSYHFITIFVLTTIFNFDNDVSSAFAILTHLLSYIIFILSTVLSIYFINKKQSSSGGEKENIFSVFKFNMDEK